MCITKKRWKIHQEMGIPEHLTCLLRNLYARQEATVRTGYGTMDWFKIGKGVHQDCILSLCLFNLYAEYIIRNAGLNESGLEARLPREISITSDMQMTPPLGQKVKRLLSSSSLSAIRVVSSAYLRLLIFLPAILIQACAFPAQRFS